MFQFKSLPDLYRPRTESRSADPDFPSFSTWLRHARPDMTWDWRHLEYVRDQLADVTLGQVDRLAISWPPQHGKTQSVTVPYPLWRMIREPGLRCGVGCYNQRYANKVSRWVRKLAVRIGERLGDTGAVDEWSLANGSTFIARGVGGGIAGEPLDLFVIDDPFKSREEADSPTVQESVYEWYMDDVTPRIQERGALVIIHARWNPGDLIGRIRRSEEADEWRYVVLRAIAGDDDPLGRAPGEALCEGRFSLRKLEQKRRVEGVGFESLYQQNEIPRGGSFFERAWFDNNVVSYVPDSDGLARLRYWDLAGGKSKASAYTSGVLMAFDRRYWYVEDVIRGRWQPAERNDIIRQTALRDRSLKGFRKTYFEQQIGGSGIEVAENLARTMASLPVEADRVTGDKLVRAQPLADRARLGLVKLVAGPWNAAFISELEAVPNGPWMDQCDSASGAFNKFDTIPTGSPAATALPPPEAVVRPGPGLTRDWAADAGLFGMG